MKIEAELKILTAKGSLNVGDNISIPVDEDYATDYDDVIKFVEDELWQKYGVSMYDNVDFKITNEIEICDELFSDED